jgi:hypothetical protein
MPKEEAGPRTRRQDAAITPDEVAVAYLQWRAAKMQPGSENRLYPRVECVGMADIRVIPDGNKESGCLVNLSKRGCCFLAGAPLCGSEGSTVEVHMKVKGIDLRVSGVIRHVDKGVRAGIEFVTVSERKCEQINDLVAELTEMDNQAARELGSQKPPEHEFATLAEAMQQEQPLEVPVHSKLLRFYRD